MSKEMRQQINKILNFDKILNENINLTKIKDYLYDYFDLNNLIEPATIPIKKNHLRLYHQTNLEKFEKIKKNNRISISKSMGKLFNEPVIIWGHIVKNINDNGFYGSPKKMFTIEYQIPENEVDKGTGGVSRDVTSDEIIAYHDPRLFNIKSIVDDYDYLNNIVENLDFFMRFKNDNETSDEHAYYLIANAIKNMRINEISKTINS